MDGSAELLRLAHLLRVSADAARDIATLRPGDVGAIHRLADQAVALAEAMEAIVRTANGSSPPIS